MTTYYILPTGNDSTGNGTSGNPWQTISKAVSSSVSGDTIHCLAGTYTTWTEQVFSAPRIIVGDSAATTIFDAAGAAVCWSGSFTAQNLTFQNARAALTNAGNTSAGVFGAEDSTNSVQTFSQCIFSVLQSNSQIGIFDAYNLPLSFIVNLTSCAFSNCTWYVPNTSGSEGFIGNRFRNASFTTNITNCSFYSNIVNTLPITTLWATSAKNSIVLTNNIIANLGTTANFNTGAATYTGTNNDILGYTSPPSLANQIASDPLFVDPGNLNFNLRPHVRRSGTGLRQLAIAR